MKTALLKPNISVGDISFGDSIEKYDNRQYEYEERLLNSTYRSYSFEDVPVTAFVDDGGRIESIRCAKECIWKEVNLIGLDYGRFVALYPKNPDGIDFLITMDEDGKNVQEQEVYDYDDIGLQLWAFEGQIVTVIATVYENKQY